MEKEIQLNREHAFERFRLPTGELVEVYLTPRTGHPVTVCYDTDGDVKSVEVSM